MTKVENRIRKVLGQGLPLSPANVGPQTDRLAYGIPALDPTCTPFAGYDSGDPTSREVGCYDEAFSARFINSLGNGGSEGRIWAGQAADFYYLDEKGIFDVLNLAGDPASSFVKVNGQRFQVPGARQRPQAENVFTGFNLFSIALEIPTSKLTGTGLPPAHNGTPGDDTLLAIHVSESRPGIYKALGVDQVPDSLKFNRVDMAIDSSFPNGRPLIGGVDLNHEQADVSDVLLTLILSPDPSVVQIGDGVDYSAVKRRTAFPFISLALQGLTQGHGEPAN